uniref:ATP synthase 8 n=1 Tax=Proasellus meridianus TaxID=1282001 RepID=A0A485M7M0_9CRUS|nr:ATP synthase 8 [Proasellus meridianus]
MPQMAPMFWTFLMVLFMAALLSFMVKLYFYLSSQTVSNSRVISTNSNPQWMW